MAGPAVISLEVAIRLCPKNWLQRYRKIRLKDSNPAPSFY